MKVAGGGRAGTVMAVLGGVLVVAATGVLLLSADTRLLRLGLVAALWAVLLAAIVATRYRAQAEESAASAANAKEIYERELEREIAARKEHELEFELRKRRELESNAQEQVNALRAELEQLQQTLRQLLDGEVLYERIALTAQATRMRASGDDFKYLEQGAGRVVSDQGRAARQVDPPTDTFAPVTDHGEPYRNGHGSGNGAPVADSPSPWFSVSDRPTTRTGGRQQRQRPATVAAASRAARHSHEGARPGPEVPRRHEHEPRTWQQWGADDGQPRGQQGESPGRSDSNAGGPEPDTGGSHSAGRPVSELLASYGSEVQPRRRRRRA
ncbi:DUF6779 domain-containing protein [Haloechinothrix sp. LS1_15]|uniref:DUF6779 domain-containing protein n=1 Tax=Haloechinothrix sp. LS1_15 TaxID=2652248 RepID=UPI0029446637|nr:DUF6779 domain-containing protein [Haloechinothrix sp. LS1_15]MDV6011428.1 hypothetical protein [Haloechinothrix sp. LS1_15]